MKYKTQEERDAYNAARRKDRHTDKKTDRHLQPSNRHITKWKRAQFIGVDGEGLASDIDEPQAYYLMCASTGERIHNSNGLTSQQCFDYLLDIAQTYKQGILCGFYISYDCNQWVRDVEKDVLHALWSASYEDTDAAVYSVGEHHYSLQYRPHKSFTIKYWYGAVKWDTTIVQGKKHYNRHYDKSVVVWDVSGFFQGAFVKVLRDWFKNEIDDNGVLCYEDERIDLVAMQSMKLLRGNFTQEQLDDVSAYCFDEVRALSLLMKRFQEYCTQAGLTLQRYDGAGAVAAAMLKKHEVKKYQIEGMIPGLQHAQLCAYSGGRIELVQAGSVYARVDEYDIIHPSIFDYDVRSAYPKEASELPNLTGGVWKLEKGYPKTEYSVCHVRFDFPDDYPFYPFFVRQAGAIYYPPKGEGWYWYPEVSAYHDNPLDRGTVDYIESYNFYPADDTRPFQFLRDYYELRKQWKQAGIGAEKILKLGPNSIYGKLAQVLGAIKTENGYKLPPYHNIGQAGRITSGTRGKLWRAAMKNPNAVIAFQTDGLFLTAPLDDMDTTNVLGNWELTTAHGGVFIQAGVYFTLHLCETVGCTKPHWRGFDGLLYDVSQKYRGFDKDSITIDAVHAGWRQHEKTGKDWYIEVPSTRFLTLGSVLSSEKLFPCWRSWHRIDRKLDLYQTHGKRVHIETKRNRPNMTRALFRTCATYPPLDRVSQPFDRKLPDSEVYDKIEGVPLNIIEREYVADSDA